jgi:3-oxoacyl-[acyl-carrier-protein] synthase III
VLLTFADVPVALVGCHSYLPPKGIHEEPSCSAANDEIEPALRAWRYSHLEESVLRRFFKNQHLPTSVIDRCSSDPVRRTPHIAFESTLELALAAARPLLKREAVSPEEIGTVMYFHQTVPDRPAWSLPCAVVHTLGLKAGRAISVSQRGATAVAAALALGAEILTMEEEPPNVLLVGAEKFVPPYKRRLDPFGTMDDGASAYLLSRRMGSGYRLQCVGWEDRPEWHDALADTDRRAALYNLLAEELAGLVRRVLETIGAAPCDVSLVFPPRLDLRPASTWATMTGLGVRSFVQSAEGWSGPLPNGDLALGLAAIQKRPPEPGRLILALSISPPSSVCCIALSRCGESGGSAVRNRTRVARACLTAAAYILPDRRLTTREWGTQAGWSSDKQARYAQGLGVTVLHVSEQRSAAEMASAAVDRLLRTERIDARSIDGLLLFHSFFLLSLEPHSLLMDVQERIGIRPAFAAALGGQHCATGLAALDVARCLIAGGRLRRILLVGADCFLGSSNREIEDVTLQGDGACAALVEADAGRGELLACGSRLDASLFQGIDAARELRERFKLTYLLGSHRVARDTLARAGLSPADVSLVVPHNVNGSSWMPVMRSLRIAPDRLFAENIDRIGHMSSIDPFANFADALAGGRTHPGDLVLLLAAGLGAVWNCAVLRV